MDLFDGIIQEFYRMLESYCERQSCKDVEPDHFAWEKADGQIILQSDAAMELGGGNLPAVSGILYTACDGPDFGTDAAETVALYGPDLAALRGNVPYARVAFVKIRKEFCAEEYKHYNLFRSIEYIRYHVSPLGYMPRISTAQNREQVRVSKAAVEAGIDFYKVGRLYDEAYLKHPAVEAVQTLFITLEDFDYKALQKLFDRAESLTMSLDHALNDLKMDCSVCNLKAVCDEVELLSKDGLPKR